jgi:hypothetical protein
MNALDSSLLLGLDSALCCFAIGCTSLAWNARLRLAFAFGACDAIASAAGALLNHPLAAPPTFATYLCCALLLGVAARYSRKLLYALPVLFSLDNFSYGDGLGNAIIDGMGSAVLALGALAAGALAFWLFRGTWPRASSAGEY